jgi:hypothetical protein
MILLLYKPNKTKCYERYSNKKQEPNPFTINVVEPRVSYSLGWESTEAYIVPSMRYLSIVRSIYTYNMKDALIHIQMQLN